MARTPLPLVIVLLIMALLAASVEWWPTQSLDRRAFDTCLADLPEALRHTCPDRVFARCGLAHCDAKLPLDK